VRKEGSKERVRNRRDERPTQEPTPLQLKTIWDKILKDADAREAIEKLKKDGFYFTHTAAPRLRSEEDFKYPNWAGNLAAIPLVPYCSARRRIYRRTSLKKYWALVGVLRQLEEKLNDRFCDVSIESITDFPMAEINVLGRRVRETADFLEQFFCWNWYTREQNPRNALIAELRWQIRYRTKRPHDVELSTLIDAAFRAAGAKEQPSLDNTALERIEKREKEGRVKAATQLRRQRSPITVPKSES